MFDNKLDSVYKIFYTRWIMSWIREGGNCKDRDGFISWLNSLKLDPDDIDNIWFIMSNGKLECETSARMFLKNQ